MSVAVYRQVLARPGVLRLLGFAVLARIPHAASTVVITLYVVQGLHLGFAAAGLVAAVSTVGTAIGGPWRGRAVDRAGLRRALLPSVLVEASTWAAIPFLSFEALLPVAFIGGLLAVPIFTVVRQSLAVLVPIPQQRTAFALDSMGTEITFMAGPTVAVLLATQWSLTGTVFAVGASIAVAGIGLMLFNPPTRTIRTPELRTPELGTSDPLASGLVTSQLGTPDPHRALLRNPALLAVLAATAGSLVILAGTDVSVVAHVRESGEVGLTWVVFIAWSLPSLVGGLMFGATRRVIPPYQLLLALGLLTIPVGLTGGVWWLALAVMPAGFLVAPTLSATAASIGRLVPEERRGEAMGWYGSAMTLGVAAGTPAAGAAIDLIGPWAGFALVGVVGVVVALIGLVLIPWGTDRPGSGDPGAPSGVSPTRRLTVSI